MKKFHKTMPFYQPLTPRDFGVDDLSQVLVVSDLHLGEGRAPRSIYWHRLENFTCDEDFAAFLQHKRTQACARGEKCLLVINGDFIDFLRITRTPASLAELQVWRDQLQEIPASDLRLRDKEELLADFDAFAACWRRHLPGRHRWRACPAADRSVLQEKRYGLDTQDFKSVYRLYLAWQGHAAVFAALQAWLRAGFPVLIITGNHDQEFDQEVVQAWLRHKLGLASHDRRLRFCGRGVELWQTVRIEHGHRYEWVTDTPVEWREARMQTLQLPAGSWFNRYFVNQIEMEVPYLDNVRPSIRVVKYLLRSHPGKAVKLLPQLLRAVFLLWPKPAARRLIYLGALQVARVMVPVAAAPWLFFATSGAERWLLLVLALLALPWLFTRWGKLLHHRYARGREQGPRAFMTKELPRPAAVPFLAVSGHTHKPDQQFWPEAGMIYLNSGTWTAVFEEESGVVRNDLSKSFVELHRLPARGWQAELKRWEYLPRPERELTLLAPRSRRQSPETSTMPVTASEEMKAKPELIPHGNGTMMPASV
ncbi:MAG: hypothetical protein ONB48_04255 [candidate division KSB1 bacterium]|nr:hypothetical protein [candidate division KSB1 bacterium]MDZ7274477.1 hypothetical protein [candidate division KSB1 bacterium]MDZ7284861.1 hypothetical protein [candidate division KSB1 bacterium]MDZ7297719.1 hypothetical protein [candidate division KSB1 bacterium]MDZ7308972.1 hypothetical protein [candidate division KSB1 bacterium]